MTTQRLARPFFFPSSVGKRTARLHGLFKKEFALQSGSGFSLVNRLLIGPLVSLATTGILYASFFRQHPHSSLGEMSGENYLSFVAFGFLMHTYLNAGYYCFSSRVLHEAYHSTLQLLWIAPYSRLASFFSLAGMEAVRCAAVLGLSMVIAGMPQAPLWQAVTGQLGAFVLFFPLCLCLGAFRVMVTLLNTDLSDLLDHAYLFFVLTACPYIPRELLPKILQPLSTINPAYHMGYVLRSLWNPSFHSPSHWLWTVALSAMGLGVGLMIWKRYRPWILERCFA
jgi:hypothetical protein